MNLSANRFSTKRRTFPTNVTRTGTMTVAGTTTTAAPNVTVNTSNSVLCVDYTFASTNHTLSWWHQYLHCHRER